MNGQHASCAAPTATQKACKTGVESGQDTENNEPFGLRAAWLHFANELEIRRLAKLHMRIERRKRGLNDLITERQKIMNRCIRRMRRNQGKN